MLQGITTKKRDAVSETSILLQNFIEIDSAVSEEIHHRQTDIHTNIKLSISPITMGEIINYRFQSHYSYSLVMSQT